MTKTLQIYYAIKLNPAEKSKDNICFIVFEKTAEKNSIFLDEAENINGLVKLIEKEAESMPTRSFKNLNIEYPFLKGHYFHDKNKTTYSYMDIGNDNIKKISGKLTKYSKK